MQVEEMEELLSKLEIEVIVEETQFSNDHQVRVSLWFDGKKISSDFDYLPKGE